MELEGFDEITGLMRCSVYALVYRREVVYVGQSRTPWSRLGSHIVARGKALHHRGGERTIKKGIPFDQIFIRRCMLNELDQLEKEMIAKYMPRYNVRGMPTAVPMSLNLLLADLIVQAPPPVAQPRLHRRF